MTNRFKILFYDKTIKRFILVNIFSIILLIIILALKWSSLPNQIPLFYSLPRSAKQLGTPISILILPGLSILFSLVSFILATLLYPKERLASLMLVASTMIATLLIFVTFLKIIFLIT